MEKERAIVAITIVSHCSRHSGEAFSMRISLLCSGSGWIIRETASWQRQGVSPSSCRATLTYLQRSTGRFTGSSVIQGCLQMACPRYRDLQHPHAWTSNWIGDAPPVPSWEEVTDFRVLTGMFTKLRLNLIWLQQVRSTVDNNVSLPPVFPGGVSGLMSMCSLLSLPVYNVIPFTDTTNSSWAPWR